MNISTIEVIGVSALTPHPLNPRLSLREDVVEAIFVQLKESGCFGEEYAPTVRPLDGGYQIVTGHHRHEAAKRAGLTDIPCWVKEMSDEEAYMRLVTDNAQGELSPLEIGLHALGRVELSAGGAGKKGGLREYARQLGKDDRTVRDLKCAANVYKTAGLTPQFSDKTTHLYEVSRAPESTWPQLCSAIEDNVLTTVEDVGKAVAHVKAIDAARPDWWKASLNDLVASSLNEPATAKRMANGLAESKRLRNELVIVTVCDHQKSQVTEMRDGREYYRMEPFERQYDAGADFAGR